MAKKIFKRDYLVNELDLPYNAIEEELIDNSRWSLDYRIVFEDNGKFYETYYSVGATECQEERPWEYEDEVECTEVEKREILVKKWVAVDN